MNVVVEIEGREAIPVRAIPFLTNWTTMSPDETAAVLAWDEHCWQFQGLHAYRIEGGDPHPIPNTWWKNFPCRAFKALSDHIGANQISHETGYQNWRRESLAVLPAGVFVWKDEYELIYYRAFGPDGMTFLSDIGDAIPEDEQAKHVALDFDAFIPDPVAKRLVMEGFETQLSAARPQVATPGIAVAAPESIAKSDTRPKADWTLIKPSRYPGYRKPLYDFMKATHSAGRPCPTPRDVLDAWKLEPPPGVQVMLDGLKYDDAAGNLKEANLKAIQQSIKGLTE